MRNIFEVRNENDYHIDKNNNINIEVPLDTEGIRFVNPLTVEEGQRIIVRPKGGKDSDCQIEVQSIHKCNFHKI